MPENRFSCALVGAASFDADHFSAEHFDKVIAVDGGFSSLCAIGVTPDFALGDFDSLGHVPQGVPIERHPVMKDDSDTALALEWAFAHGMREVAVYGALGGRLDHFGGRGARGHACGRGRRGQCRGRARRRHVA